MNKRILLSSVTIAVVSMSVAVPSFAYLSPKTPLATLTAASLRRQMEVRGTNVAYRPIADPSHLLRGNPVDDTSGRAHLARAKLSVRRGMRNLNRHLLGLSRNSDYRVLDMRGDLRRKGFVRNANLPPRLVRTGKNGSNANFGRWMWDRPSRRDIRENKFLEMSNNSRNVSRGVRRNAQ